MTDKPEKTYKREVGALLLMAAAVISFRYWTLSDAALVASYGGGYGTAMLALIPSGIAPFAIQYIWKTK